MPPLEAAEIRFVSFWNLALQVKEGFGEMMLPPFELRPAHLTHVGVPTRAPMQLRQMFRGQRRPRGDKPEQGKGRGGGGFSSAPTKQLFQPPRGAGVNRLSPQISPQLLTQFLRR